MSEQKKDNDPTQPMPGKIQRVVIKADFSQSFSLDRFQVAAKLLGAKHEFTFSNKSVTVELPREDNNLPRELRSAICRKWQRKGTKEIPLEYEVKEVVIRIAVEDPLSIPEQALKVSPKRIELFTTAEREQLDNLIGSLRLVAFDAFTYWVAMLRWVSHNAYVGEPAVMVAAPIEGTATLRDSVTGHRFWLDAARLTGRMSKGITPAQWRSAQTALRKNNSPPIWFNFLFEGAQRINNRDLVGAVLSLAITFETIVRSLLTYHLEKQRNKVEPLVFMILDLANLRAIFQRLRKLRFWDKDWERVMDFCQFHKLMDWRDGVMHSASIASLNEKDLRKTYTKLEALAYFVSEHLARSKPPKP